MVFVRPFEFSALIATILFVSGNKIAIKLSNVEADDFAFSSVLQAIISMYKIITMTIQVAVFDVYYKNEIRETLTLQACFLNMLNDSVFY